MSKAFDKVRHDLLIDKLWHAGFCGNLLTWFHAYLYGRRQRVTVQGVTSRDLPVTSGVPQGSILGPALFLLFVNNLPDSLSNSNVLIETLRYDNENGDGDVRGLGRVRRLPSAFPPKVYITKRT